MIGPRLDQQHLPGFVLGQPRRERDTSGAATHDDVVVFVQARDRTERWSGTGWGSVSCGAWPRDGRSASPKPSCDLTVSEDQNTVDLLEQLRVALDDVEPLLAGRIVDIEMARLRVLTDPLLFRREFASLMESAVARRGTDTFDHRAGRPNWRCSQDRGLRRPRRRTIGPRDRLDDRAAGARSVQRRRRLTCPGSSAEGGHRRSVLTCSAGGGRPVIRSVRRSR